MYDKVIIEWGLWQACKQGNRQAYGTIYKIFYPRLYAYGLKFTPDPILVEDCIQEVFAAFWANRQKLSAVKTITTYLFVSFRHRLFKEMQKQHLTAARLADQDGYPFQLQLSADQLMIDAEKMFEQSICLGEAIDRLTTRQKEAVYLKFYLDLPYDDISVMMGVSVKATYKLIARAVHELRQTYQAKMSSLTMGFSIIFFTMTLLFT